MDHPGWLVDTLAYQANRLDMFATPTLDVQASRPDLYATPSKEIRATRPDLYPTQGPGGSDCR
jgi:hypothetical protein